MQLQHEGALTLTSQTRLPLPVPGLSCSRQKRTRTPCPHTSNASILLLDAHVLQNLKFAGMMQYDGDLGLPKNFLVPPPEIKKVRRLVCS
eukprot:scaffold226657_cov15-Tisochrysis_lutea.AAC.1